MNKFLDDISEYKIVNRLQEKLQESENLKIEIEAILIKRVFIALDDLNNRIDLPTSRNVIIDKSTIFSFYRMLC